MKFKAAIAQIDPKVGNLQANIELHLRSIDAALKDGAQLILFPELSLTGYTLRDIAWEISCNPFSATFLEPLVEKSRSISIALGFVESGSNHAIYNSALFLEDGEIKHVHRKTYPPTYGMFEEGRYFSSGNSVTAFDSKHGRFGLLICEDIWHLSMPYLLAHDGAEALLTLTASPSRLSSHSGSLLNAEINHEQHRVYARLLSAYILFSNRVGFEDGVNFWGGSSIVGPGGEMLATAKLFDEDLIFAQLDSSEVQRARRFSRHFLDENIELVHRTLGRILDDRHKNRSV